ncbi:hypothetical protein ACQY1H_14115 [Agrobacterium vitis]|uniref:hypothetical protein n=1 Tax=Agrobacterium vitis TaxID=373 RepID=UPI003D2D1F18
MPHCVTDLAAIQGDASVLKRDLAVFTKHTDFDVFDRMRTKLIHALGGHVAQFTISLRAA